MDAARMTWRVMMVMYAAMIFVTAASNRRIIPTKYLSEIQTVCIYTVHERNVSFDACFIFEGERWSS
jgi:hypothetical protein